MNVLVSAMAIVVLLGAIIPSVMASDVGDQRDFIYGWRDAYYNWSHFAKYPNDEDGHDAWYWQGVDAGWKYAREHVKVMVVQGHVLTDLNATQYMTGWFDGQFTRSQGLPRMTIDEYGEYGRGF